MLAEIDSAALRRLTGPPALLNGTPVCDCRAGDAVADYLYRQVGRGAAAGRARRGRRGNSCADFPAPVT